MSDNFENREGAGREKERGKVKKWFKDHWSDVLMAMFCAFVFICIMLPFVLGIAKDLWAWALA